MYPNKKEMSLSFLESPFPWKRCPILPQKVKIKRFLRVSSVIQNRVQKNNNEYIIKGFETFLNKEISHLPILKNFEEIYLMNELINFFLYRDDLKKIKDEKYQLKIIICISQVIIKRIFIPFLINFFLSYLDK